MPEPNVLGLTLLLALVGYAVGCVNTGYYLVLWRTGQDIRTLGSGNAGARNVGRVLGRSGFFVTLAGDILKGAVAVLLARLAGLPEWAWIVVMAASVAGHLWPLQLQGRGGKGAATAFGGLLALSLPTALVVLAVVIVLRVVTKKTILSGAVTALLTPLLAWLLGVSGMLIMGMGVLLLLLAFTHRDNLRSVLAGSRSSLSA